MIDACTLLQTLIKAIYFDHRNIGHKNLDFYSSVINTYIFDETILMV